MSKLPPKSPRFKVKKTRPKKSEDFPTIQDMSEISPEVPDRIKIGIAEAIVGYSALENSAETLIWDLTGLSFEDGKLLTKIDSRGKFDLLKKLMARYNLPLSQDPERTKALWTIITDIIESRNKIAHGVWVMFRETTPLTASFRISGGEPDHIVGERFSLRRLETIALTCWQIKGLIDDLANKRSASRAKPSAPHPQETASRHKHPSPRPK
jgi:hypothetical protein